MGKNECGDGCSDKGGVGRNKEKTGKRDETVPWRVEIYQEHIVNNLRKRIVQYVTTNAENERRQVKDPELKQTMMLVDNRATADAMGQMTNIWQV